MAIHWQIPFKSLRSGTVYTVNIYENGYSGDTVVLKGGAEPFTTEEDDDENQFTEIRTQSGYIRFVDDGFAADGETAVNWKDILPTTDTDRPVTLTNGNGGVMWMGFMQSQNFSGRLYGNPQEREFPIQCPLTITEGQDINYYQTSIQNFAYLLKQVIDSIPSTCQPSNIYIQGGSDAQAWLLKKIDWQNFVSEDSDGNLSARYSLFQCLEDMCRFWGWTARMNRDSLYLTCSDDANEQTWLSLSYSDLATMAGGTAAGSVSSTWASLEIIDSYFASNNNDDYRQRGTNKATVKADANSADDKVVNFSNSKFTSYMDKRGWQSRILYDEKYLQYTNDVLSFDLSAVTGSAVSGNASFNIARIISGFDNAADENVIKIKKTYTGSTFASLQSKYDHLFNADGRLILHGKIYRRTEALDDHKDNGVGNKSMYMRLGIGNTRNTAVWFNGQDWQSTETTFEVSIGNTDNTLHPRYNSTNTRPVINLTSSMTGKMFVDFLGSDDIDDIDGEKLFDIHDFDITFERREWYNAMQDKIDRDATFEYTSSNTNSIREEWNADCIFASDNNMPFGYGVLMNTDGTYMTRVEYNESGTNEYPEQHLANRVTRFWETSKRRLSVELKAYEVPFVTPRYRITVDGTSCHPIGISRNWRDDIMTIVLLEMPSFT